MLPKGCWLHEIHFRLERISHLLKCTLTFLRQIVEVTILLYYKLVNNTQCRIISTVKSDHHLCGKIIIFSVKSTFLQKKSQKLLSLPFCHLWMLIFGDFCHFLTWNSFSKNRNFRVPKNAKTALLELLHPQKSISRKIWMADKWWIFLIVGTLLNFVKVMVISTSLNDLCHFNHHPINNRFRQFIEIIVLEL